MAKEKMVFSLSDWAAVLAGPLVLFTLAVFSGRSLTTHETVHCQNVREMLEDGDWIIPHYGGRVWLERPPLPHWLTAAVVAATGQFHAEWPYRLSAALAGTFVAALIGWIAAVWYGRAVGILAAWTFATTRIGFGYSTDAEADIFLAAIVTAVTALFVKSYWRPSSADHATSFFGLRGWDVLALFVLLGLTNFAKGLFFGMTLATIPIAAFLLGQFSGTTLKRYVWFWGWLAFALTALAWPLSAYLREPGILELWKSDYLGRLNQGYMREPAWYYLVQLPWSLFPWTPTVFVGLWLAIRRAKDSQSPERFLLVWAVLPVAFLSIPQGKHHHYLLSVIGPWCIFSALAAERAWAWLRSFPRWMRHPVTSAALVGIGLIAAAIVFRHRLAASDATIAWIILGLVLAVIPFRWALDHANRQIAAIGTFAFMAIGFLAFEYGTAAFGDSYAADRQFTLQVRQHIPPHETLYVMNEPDPLDSSWMLFYLPHNTRFLHNPSFLLAEDIADDEVWLLARGWGLRGIHAFGHPEPIFSSAFSRAYKTDPMERWALYRVKLHPDRQRVDTTNVKISPMQATGREKGPFLAPVPSL